MECLPPAHADRRFYEPTDRGFEKRIRERLDERAPPQGALELHLPEHLGAQRQDEREPVVALHPADRDADELAVAVQHAAARDPGMAVGQARHELVGGALADVTGRDDDALRVVVAQPEDRVGEVEPVRRGSLSAAAGRWLLDLEDRPVARIDFDACLARVHDARWQRTAVVDRA